MAKKNKKQQQHGSGNSSFSPEKYLRTRVRALPLGKCYKFYDETECGEIIIVVSRIHPDGDITYAAYLLDLYCVGVKNTMWNFHQSENTVKEMLAEFSMENDCMDEIPYVEAHNWVYGAMEFALEAGIDPCKEFSLTRYVLEEDNEDVELIEYEFGHNGRHFLIADSRQEAAHYIAALNSNLGEGNYDFSFADDDVEKIAGSLMDRLYQNDIPIEYTYKAPVYPHYDKLNHPEIKEILLKNETDFAESDLKYLLSLPADTLREDLHSIILDELAWQAENDIDVCDETGHSYSIFANIFIVLAGVGNVTESLPLVLETLKMDKKGIDYYYGDLLVEIIVPLLCALIDGDVSLLVPFMLEPGITEYPKTVVAGVFERVGVNCPDRREEVIEQLRILLTRYREELPENKICNGAVAAFTIGAASVMGAEELIPEIKALFATGLVNEGVEGDLDEVLGRLHAPEDYQRPLPPVDPYQIRKKLVELL